MLVLTRTPGDTIILDGGIEVTILWVRGGRVGVGITAPTDINIARGELPEATEHS